MLARALRAGHSVVGAMEMLAENAQETGRLRIREIFKQQNSACLCATHCCNFWIAFPRPTARSGDRNPGAEGHRRNLAEILDRTVFVIRERLRIQGEIQVQTAREDLPGGF